MGQDRVTSPGAIYDALSDDTEFMSYVGEYVFVNSNNTLPSICVTTPNIPIPNLKDVLGLEVLIHDIASISRIDYLTDASNALATYEIYLILWTGVNGATSGANLTNAASRIVEMFSGARSILTVPVNKTPNVAIQMVVRVPNNALIQV